jgi:hypothetical protein
MVTVSESLQIKLPVYSMFGGNRPKEKGMTRWRKQEECARTAYCAPLVFDQQRLSFAGKQLR